MAFPPAIHTRPESRSTSSPVTVGSSEDRHVASASAHAVARRESVNDHTAQLRQRATSSSVSRCEEAAACHKVLVEGRQLLSRGRYEPARAAFASAFEQSHDIEVLVNLGRRQGWHSQYALPLGSGARWKTWS